jgi:L-fuculose-phosphate aldolase
MDKLAAIGDRIIDIGRRMYDREMIAGTSGNISCRLTDDRILITRSGAAKGRLAPGDLVVINGDGKIFEGTGRPSSEFRLHNRIYELRSDVASVIHAHPVYCTAWATVEKPLPDNVFPEIVLMLGDIPLADYGTPSTDELPKSIEKLILDRDVILLRNHGVVAVAGEIEDAYNKLEMAEQCSRIQHEAEAIGGAKPLSSGQIDKLLEIRQAMFENRSNTHGSLERTSE